MKLGHILITAMAFCCLCRVGAADAAATVTLTQAAEGVYAVTVANVEKALSIGFTIRYDGGALTNPVLADGPFAKDAGATSIPYNDSAKGEFRVVYFFVKDALFNGGGQLATVTFTKTGVGAVRTPELTSEIITEAGTQAAVQSIVTPLPGVDPVTMAAGSTTGTTDAGSLNNPTGSAMGATTGNQQTAASTAATIGSVAYQGTPQPGEQKTEPVRDPYHEEPATIDQQQNQSGNPEAVQQENAGTAEPADSVAVTATEKPLKAAPMLKTFTSIAERFRSYAGPQTLAGFTGLFSHEAARRAGVIQTPTVAVADGRSLVTIALDFGDIKMVPSFTLKGANLKSIRNPTASSWVLDALPQRGKLDIQLSIQLQGELVTIPLNVIPELTAAARELPGKSEAVINGLIAQAHLKGAHLVYDLNGDGVQDFRDDYILAGHWLLNQHPDAKKNGRKPVVPVH